MARIRPQTGFETVLSSGISAAATSIGITTAPTETTGYMVIEPGTSNKEIIKYTGVTGTTLTGVSRGLALVGASDAAGTGKAHAAGVPISMTNVHYYMEQLAQESEANTWTAVQTFEATPVFESAEIKIGDGSTDEDEKITANNGDAAKPYIKYNSATNKWLISNDGSNSYDPEAGGSGVTAGTDITIVGGAVSLDTTITQDINFTGTLTGIMGLSKSFTAGENLTAGNAVIVAYKQAATLEAQQTTAKDGDLGMGTTTWLAQTFLTSNDAAAITSIKFTNGDTVGSGDTRASIRATSGGNPTGADLGSGTVTASNNDTEYTVTFATPIPVSPSTTYALVLRRVTNTTNIGTVSSNPYADGKLHRSTNSGSTWDSTTYAAYDIKFKIYEIDTISPLLYKADASSADVYANNFIGFAAETKNAGETTRVNLVVDDNQTGLSVGSTYYLSDTSGTISTSAGSTSRKVGIAMSATEILIKHDNV